ncbi:hypothetical protein EWM64_g9371 [Hericium alpestre]|uniref:Uncharacterized protein n=1 Tax=Hericium alpestre TaxID=135208 RepID=A0A4Y9ZLE3_9AGAM|nr:hypothetical protein EWM64_g9371 [Hericium alpestre]
MASKRRGDDHPPGRVAQAPRTGEQDIDINKGFNDAFYRKNAEIIGPCLLILNSSLPRNDHLLNLMSSVFSSLVEEDKELDRRYEDMPQKRLREVLRPPPVLTLMEEALRSGDWTAIRGMNYTIHFLKKLSPNAENADGDAFATQGAWKTPYHGDYARLMRDTLNTMNSKHKRSDVYANFVPIVQSSGTGKSRTVDEMVQDYLSGKENAIEEIFKGLNLTLQKDPVTEQGLDNANDDSKTAASSSDVQSKGHGEDIGNEKHRVPFNAAQTSVSRAANYIIQVINENIGQLNTSRIHLLIYVDEAQSLMNLRKPEKAVVAPEVMVRFGRPLWWTRWDNGNYEVRKDIFKYAQAKFRGENGLDAERLALSMTPTAELAVLGERVLLNFEPRHTVAIDIENELIEGHMRIAYSVPKHQEFLYSGASSEPVLAETAARLMNGPDFFQIWPRRLARHVETGIIDKGQAGELAFRLILTLAHDVAVRLLPGNEDDVEQWDVPIPLDVFLVALFGKEDAEKVLESHPDNVPEGQTLREAFKGAFKGAKVRFSHFVQAYDATIVTDEAIWAALARGMAFQCYSTQAIIDIIIPLLLWDKKLGRHVVSAIFVQVKNTSKEKKPEIKVESLKFFSEEGADEKSKTRPYITLVVNLGVHRPKSDSAKGLTKVPSSQSSSSGKSLSDDMPSTPQQRLETSNRFGVGIPPSGRLSKARKAKQPRKYSTHHRYSMEITGCSPTVYPYVVTTDQSNYFAQLLGRRELIDEHPRQTERALRSVLQLKPYWSCKLRSFNWAGRSPDSESSRPAFQEDYPEEDLPDTVKVVSFVEEGEGEGEEGEEGEEDRAD